MIKINDPSSKTYKTAFLHLAFRPFFLAAFAYAALSIFLWMLLYSFNTFSSHSQFHLLAENYPMTTWHAHEMLFGYALAVIVGFLLTASKNWTGTQTLHQKPLLCLWLLWLFARILSILPYNESVALAAIFDLLFIVMATLSFSIPVYRAKQYKNLAFTGKLILLFFAQILFYLGLFGFLENGVSWGIYAGLYLILAVIFNLGRRVIPFFIERGVMTYNKKNALNQSSFHVKNYTIIDRASLVIFSLFAFFATFYSTSHITFILAALLFCIHCIRLYGWHHPVIWKLPLLWGIYLGYIWITLGFLLFALSSIINLSPFLPVHAFAYGGIGIMTANMMARVSLGHTGNNIYNPPKNLTVIFVLLSLGAIIRVIFPLFFSKNYTLFITLAQTLWIISFGLLFFTYASILIKPRIDDRYG